jgi:EAL domain-containing protein (putative c-di-GMP-specific phosphodiesterase class I)
MIKLDTKIKNLQSAIHTVKHGYCLAFRLLNYSELNILIDSSISIMEKLDSAISEVCNQYTELYKETENDRIFIVLPITDRNLIKEIALKIHYLSQLYSNDAIPEFSMNCCIASVAFSSTDTQAEKIYNLLNWLLCDQTDQSYYREYDPLNSNLEAIRKSNIKLNLLRKSLRNKTMVFAYQPIIDRKTMKIDYYECLMRIPDERNNLFSAGEVIQDAEKRGLIFIIDKIVLEMAITELSSNKDLTLAVNISNIGVLDQTLLTLAENLLQKHDVSGRLIIEITETTLNQNYEETALFMHKLRKFGCKFALDDFGSGFTSFTQLQKLPIDIIKIDGSYVRNITSDVQSQDFVARLIKISESLGMHIVAEFVENEKIAQFLINLKVDGMQGDFFSPASIHKIENISTKA